MDVRSKLVDPIAFIGEVLVDPETGQPFRLYPAQKRFLKKALAPTAEGRIPYPEIVYSAPKKSGKTTTAALATLYVVICLGGSSAEAYCVANDLEQAQGRVFSQIGKIVRASPLLAPQAKILANRIEFSTGATITAIASDYAGAAGVNPTIVVFDELWAYTTERSRRLWDELVPVPTRKVSVRLTVTYAGFEGESKLLEELYKKGMGGEEIGPGMHRAGRLLLFWSHDPVAPWQDEDWLAQMREQLRPSAYLRMVENRFVSSESGFISQGVWDACTDPELRPALTDPNLPVWVGVDASITGDSTAIVACTCDKDQGRVRLVYHRIFQPSSDHPLDFEATIEQTLLDLKDRFCVREVLFDPYQMVALAQRLERSGLPMREYQQTGANLTEASMNLLELAKGRNIVAYPDPDLRLALSRAIAVESARGLRIAKGVSSHKIDVVVALAMSALGAVQAQREPEIPIVVPISLIRADTWSEESYWSR